MDLNYLEGLKNHYEHDLMEISPKAQEFIQEMINGAATVIDYIPYDPREIRNWIEQTVELMGMSSDEEDEDLFDLFPNIFDYRPYAEEIAYYFLLEDIKDIKRKISENDNKMLEMIIKLDWVDMMPSTIRDVFVF